MVVDYLPSQPAKLLKDREARNIYMCSTFGLFTSGLEKFDKAYEEGLFTKVLTTSDRFPDPGSHAFHIPEDPVLLREQYLSLTGQLRFLHRSHS